MAAMEAATRSSTPYQLTPEQIGASVPAVLGLGMQHFVGQALYAVVKLEVPNALGSETLTVDQITERVSGTPNRDTLLRTLRFLATCSPVLEEVAVDGDFAFRLTPSGALLQTGVAGQPSMACGVHHWLEPPMWSAWGALPGYVAGTEASHPFLAANGKPIFDFYAENPASGAPFNEFMSFFSHAEIPVVVNSFDWTRFNGKTVVDVGGSYGPVMAAVKGQFSDVRCISFDLPEVISAIEAAPEGVELVAGDMFQASTIPPCDAIFMKHILHDWSDEDSVRILKSCHEVLPADGTVIIADAVLPPPGEATDIKPQQVGLDLLMMIIQGKERTQAQWAALADEAGFTIQEVIMAPIPNCQMTLLAKK